MALVLRVFKGCTHRGCSALRGSLRGKSDACSTYGCTLRSPELAPGFRVWGLGLMGFGLGRRA